ncbi:MAG TPA: hypothetical protein PLK94_10455 [Alphaproteobacteria bacterium]|nr:hypothetical protein [Alphaproteobacteria bacterium]
MKQLSRVLGVVGILVALYAVVGRFVGAPVVLSAVREGGFAAGSLLTAANTLMLAAVMLNVFSCPAAKDDSSEKSDTPAAK